MPDISTIKVVLPDTQVIRVQVGQVSPIAPGFSLNGSSSSVSLVAGTNITLSQSNSSITIIGAAGGTGGATFSLNASTGSVSLVAGNSITLLSNASTITINGPTIPVATNFSLNGTSSSVSLLAGANITINSGASSMTIVGPTVPAATNFSLDGTSSSVSLSAGAGIGIGQANSTITVSASNQSALVSIASIAGGASSGTANTASSTAFEFVAGSNITLSQLSTNPSITIIGASGGGGGSAFTLNGTSDSVSLVAGANITFNSGESSITVVGRAAATQSLSAAGTSVTGTAVSLDIEAGDNITLATATAAGKLTVSITGVAASAQVVSAFGTGVATSTGTIVLAAGNNITLNTGASSITIVGPTVPAATNFSLNGSSSSVSLVAGANINLASNASTITISAANSGTVVSGFQISGNTSGTSSLITNGTVYLQAVSMLGLSQSTTTGANSTTSNVVSIFGPAYSAGAGLGVSTTGGSVSYAATNFVSSVNGSSGSLSISAGAGIGIGQANSTVTISANVQTSLVTGSVAGNTLSAASVTGTYSNSLVISAQGIISGAMSTSGNTLILSASSAAVVSAFGTGAATSTGTIVLAAGANITLNTGVSSITIVGPTVPAATNFVLNGTSSSVSISAGAGIGIGQANSTITISANVQTSSISLTALGNTTASSAGTFSNLLNLSGAGIVSVGVGAASATISATTANVVSAFGTGAATSTGTIVLAAGANITLNTGAGSITIVGPGAAAAGTQSFSGGGTSVTGTAISVALVGGNNISLASASGAGSLSLTLNASANALNNVSLLNASSGAMSVSAGVGIGIGQANSTITISSPIVTRLSYTQNFPLNEAVPILVGSLTTTGTTGASAAANPFGSSLSIQRMYIPAAMSLTEVDLAFGVSFPATNQGQGSISQSLIIYSFGNSTSLASVLSASRAVSWATGTSSAGTSSSLQHGWASNQIQPFTFAASALAAGEYAVAHLMSWAAASTSWTISVFGANNTIASLSAGSVHTASNSAVFTAWSAFPAVVNAITSIQVAAASGMSGLTQNATNNVSWFVSRATSAVSSVASATSSFTFVEAPFVGSIAQVAGSIITQAVGTVAVPQAISTSGYSVLLSGGLLAGSFMTATSGIPGFAYNGSFAMTTAATDASYLSGPFNQGLMKTGSWPASIDLRSTAVTVTGSSALLQPWFALAGS